FPSRRFTPPATKDSSSPPCPPMTPSSCGLGARAIPTHRTTPRSSATCSQRWRPAVVIPRPLVPLRPTTARTARAALPPSVAADNGGYTRQDQTPAPSRTVGLGTSLSTRPGASRFLRSPRSRGRGRSPIAAYLAREPATGPGASKKLRIPHHPSNEE